MQPDRYVLGGLFPRKFEPTNSKFLLIDSLVTEFNPVKSSIDYGVSIRNLQGSSAPGLQSQSLGFPEILGYVH